MRPVAVQEPDAQGRVDVTYQSAESMAECAVVDVFFKYMAEQISMRPDAPSHLRSVPAMWYDKLQKWCDDMGKSYPSGMREAYGIKDAKVRFVL